MFHESLQPTLRSFKKRTEYLQQLSDINSASLNYTNHSLHYGNLSCLWSSAPRCLSHTTPLSEFKAQLLRLVSELTSLLQRIFNKGVETWNEQFMAANGGLRAAWEFPLR